MHYLISVTIITAILVSYGLLLLVIDYFVNNYGECIITINNEKKIKVLGGQRLNNNLIQNKIFIPSACGGKGTCGYCKCSIISGAGPVLPTEINLLTKEDLRNNKRLSCQIKVKNDLVIEIPADMLYAQEFKCKISKIESLTYDIKLIRFDFLENKTINFKPGQYMQFKIPGSEEFRAYSIASDPHDKTKIEFMVRKVPNGVCSTYIHEKLVEGDEIILTGPYGDFYLRDSSNDVICVAGGVGVPPLRSIIQYLFSNKTDRRVMYFFGARTKKDLYFFNEPTELAQQYQNFIFVPALSEPDINDNWAGETGFIHKAIDKYVKDAKNVELYLCGPEPMIQAILNVMRTKGISENNIFYDKF